MEFEALRERSRKTTSRAEGGQGSREKRAEIEPGPCRTDGRLPGVSGAKPGAKIWNPTATTQTGFRAVALTCGMVRSSISRLFRAKSERWCLEATSIGSRSKSNRFKKAEWKALKTDCAGRVGSLIDLLQGKLSAQVMEIMTRRETGLFPRPIEIGLNCSCPDWAGMCKHVAATLYAVGVRLDESPELLFVLARS